MSTYDPSIVASLAHDPIALRAYLDAQNGSGVQVVADSPAPVRAKRSSARSAPKAKATSKAEASPAKGTRKAKASPAKGKRKAKAAPSEWVVSPDWAGVEASPRMVGAALYWGIPVATCNKLRGDKLALATAIGVKRGIPIVTR